MTPIKTGAVPWSDASIPPSEPMEPMLFTLYVREWAKNQKKTDDRIEAMENVNTKLSRLNTLLASLGKLHTQVGDAGDAKKLIDVLNKEPDLIYQINQEIKQAELPESLFGTSEGRTSKKWDEYVPAISDIPALSRSLGVQVLKDWGGQNFPGIQYFFQNHLNFKPGRIQDITQAQWQDLAARLFEEVQAGQNQISVPLQGFGADANAPVGSMGWLSYTYVELSRDRALRFNEAQASRVSGGLTKSQTGADLYKAVQLVKSEITNVSNRLQSATTSVNQSIQVTTAIMSAITDITHKMFDAKSKALG